jgi:hypothetical protein
MPKKWTHLKFMTELVYDLIFPGQMITHLSSLKGLDDQSIDSTKTLSSFNSVNKTKLEDDIDLDCDTGREHYLSTLLPTPMTRNAIHTNKPWPKWHDGLWHASLPVTGKHCQYCLF